MQQPLVVLVGVAEIPRRHREILGADEVRERRLVHEGVHVGLLDGAFPGVLVLLAGLVELRAGLHRGKGACQLGRSAAETGRRRQAAGLHLGQLLLVALQLGGGRFQLLLCKSAAFSGMAFKVSPTSPPTVQLLADRLGLPGLRPATRR